MNAELVQDTAAPRATGPDASRWRDWIGLGLIATACLVLRLPALDRIALNPDESQYEATAAYLLATDTSPFVAFHGGPYTAALFKAFAWLFGPYAMTPMRALVLLVCLACSCWLYWAVRRETSPLAGLVSGLVFLHYAVYFEGFSANREWFAGPLILAGILLHAVSTRQAKGRAAWSLFAAGLVGGASVYFKFQAVYMLASIPMVLVWQWSVGDRPRRARRLLASYVAGGAVCAAMHLLPFLLAGSLGPYLAEVVERNALYVVQNESAMESLGSRWSLYFQQFYWDRPFGSILLAAYGIGLVGLGAMALRLVTRRASTLAWAQNPVLLSFACLLLTSLLSVQTGLRFFGHYFLFMMAPVAALLGFAVHATGGANCKDVMRAGRTLAAALLALLVLHELARGLPMQLLALLSRWPSSVPRIAYLLAWLVLLAFVAAEWRSRLRRGALLALLLLTVALVLSAQLADKPRSFPFHPDRFARLDAELQQRRSAGDRLFVWGWLPELYSLTGMQPASQLTNCMYVVNDFGATPRPGLEPTMAAMLMEDLVDSEPEFIVDASRRSWTLASSGDPWLYDLDRYPEFALRAYLETHYRRAGSHDGCELYVRAAP